MTLIENDGQLLARYGNGTTAHWGRLVEAAPDGVTQAERVATADGRTLRATWVQRPGFRQAERVAWPA